MSLPWVVLKFGGTSVSTPARWRTITARVSELARDHRVLVVVSALSEVSNRLEQALADAAARRDGQAPDGSASSSVALDWIVARHVRLMDELSIPDAPRRDVLAIFDDVRQRLEGVRLTEEAPPRLRARVMAAGELASSTLGAAVLRAAGLDAEWLDVRRLLVADPRPAAAETQQYLDARVAACRDPQRIEPHIGAHRVAITQGFIASTAHGETCLLGRGGSDTSAALLAALVRAEELEIWTDVHGLFTADPRRVPTARLIRRIGYREAQELAAMGAKVLHPRCLGPVAEYGIPLSVRCTDDPAAEGTRIEAIAADEPAVTAVTCRTGVTLLSIETLAMWETAGFLAQVFAPFARLGISIDLIATSESSVTLTLDKIPGGVDGRSFAALLAELEPLGSVRTVHPAAVIAIVGRRIRMVLHELGPALAAFRDRPVHLVSQSAEDLNASFVVDEDDAPALVEQLHAALFAASREDERFGPTWERLRSGVALAAVPPRPRWWRARRTELLALAADGRPRYVYDLPTVRAHARELVRRLPAVDRFYYAMKANAAAQVIAAIAAEGFGIECVSAAEIRHARAVVGDRTPLLFTPSFCPVDEFRVALEQGADVTLDAWAPFELAPDVFRGARIGLRVDPGQGRGHHEKVRTAGAHAKFGVPLGEIDAFLERAGRAGATVTGIHAHAGSGIFDPESWSAIGSILTETAERIGSVRWIDLGGGLGVPERPGQQPLDLDAMQRALEPLRTSLGPTRGGGEVQRPATVPIELRLEPGRFLVSEAGVLLALVTQVRRKGGVEFVGTATGMNSLIRPALYGAWHAIHNLTRLDDEARHAVHVVGPICESGDVLGHDRLLPVTAAGDVLLIENAGAYGAVMASRYNLREPAEEVALD